jgi:DNA polymerase-1
MKPQEQLPSHMKTSKKTVVLLDAHAILHRGYHAMSGFSTRDGRPTGALYGFVTMTLRIKEVLKPDYVIACYDLPKPTFRHTAYEGYKAGRAKTDDALISQIQESSDVCHALGIPIYSAEGFEADDMLGTIVEQTKDNKELRIIIASGDMDTMQLIEDGRVKVFTMRKGSETVLYDESAVKERYGFLPKQIPDYKGLAGDTSDNITGVPGIGEKTATELIKKYGSIEKIYTVLKEDRDKLLEDGFKERARNLLEEGEEEAYFSKTLATIRRDAPITFVVPEKTWVEGIDIDTYKAMCDRFEFRSLKNKFDSFDEVQKAEEESEEETEGKEGDVEKLKVMLNLVDSEITNPDWETIKSFTKAKTVDEAEKVLEEMLKKEKLFTLYKEVEEPLMKRVSEMEINGVMVDTDMLGSLSKEMHKEVAVLEKEIFKLAGKEFLISSPKQLGEVLYGDLGLGTKIKKTSTGALSTNAKELDKLVGAHPIIEKVLEYRELTKLLSTYIDTLPTYVKEDGRIHAHFVQSGTGTGRFSCEDPNLQNLPVKSERGKKIREAFIAPKGKLLLSCDYAQIDLRAAAILSQDQNLVEIFEKGIDVHTGTASRMFGVKEDKVTPDMRRKAKAINFGILYGMGINALKEGMNVERKEAQEFYEQYKFTFSRLMEYLDEIKAFATKNGYTETLLGRKRRVPLLRSPLPFLRAQGERIAINAPMQGTSADVLKLAILDVHEHLEKNNLLDKVKIILQIHDELVYEIDESLNEKEINTIVDVMKQVLAKRKLTTLPLEVAYAVGKNLKAI